MRIPDQYKGEIMISKKLLLTSVFAAGLLVGCGGGSGSTPAATSSTGYLVDAAVANADYDCVADGTMNKKTGPDGSFTCKNMADVRFRLGNLVLGEIAIPADGYVFPQDMIGVTRNDVNDARVTAMAQLLQALDADGNPSNGITITANEKEMLVQTQTPFVATEVNVYLQSASVNPEHIPTPGEAQQHLKHSVDMIHDHNHDAGHDTDHDDHEHDQEHTPSDHNHDHDADHDTDHDDHEHNEEPTPSDHNHDTGYDNHHDHNHDMADISI